MDLQKRRVQLALVIVGIIALSMAAEKCREIIGEESSSKSGKFTLLNCFDMGSGTLSCSVKEGIKLYVYNIRNAHVERIRQRATEISLTEALQAGLSPSDAAKQAQKAGTKAGKVAAKKAKRILGPIISSGWDFFEAMYFEGTMTEGFLRGSGTLFGTYVGGFFGEQRLGKFGYLTGSHMGSWIGGRIGLMVYDVVSGVSHLLQFVESEESSSNFTGNENSDSYEAPSEYGSYYEKPPSEEGSYNEAADENSESFTGWGLF